MQIFIRWYTTSLSPQNLKKIRLKWSEEFNALFVCDWWKIKHQPNNKLILTNNSNEFVVIFSIVCFYLACNFQNILTGFTQISKMFQESTTTKMEIWRSAEHSYLKKRVKESVRSNYEKRTFREFQDFFPFTVINWCERKEYTPCMFFLNLSLSGIYVIDLCVFIYKHPQQYHDYPSSTVSVISIFLW